MGKYMLFSTCIVIKGAKRSVILDLQRDNYELIPNFLAENLINGSIDTSVIFDKFIEHDRIIIQEYIQFLINNEYIIEVNDQTLKFFPKLDIRWDYPSTLSNIIIDINNYTDKNTLKCIFDEINSFFIPNIQIRIFSTTYLTGVINMINQSFSNSNTDSISMILPFTHNSDKIFKKIVQNKKINHLIFHSSPFNNLVPEYQNGLYVSHTQSKITCEYRCGCISELYFTTNIEHYTESLAHNTCLNRKIAIDAEGNIKNCPSMKESFGNIKDTTLEEAINKSDFKKYWNIKKDDITKCKDCEFRHVCTDCRAYIDNPEDIYSAPLKCGYDPYTCTWEEWSTNPLKQKAIDYYGMREILTSENEI